MVTERSAVFGALKETGNYYRPGGDGELDYWIWAQQLFVWGLITVIARMVSTFHSLFSPDCCIFNRNT